VEKDISKKAKRQRRFVTKLVSPPKVTRNFDIKELLENSKGSIGELLVNIFKKLYDHFGPQNWWPGDTRLEVCIGAILTQNTSWKNVARAIENLKKRNLLTIDALYNIDQAYLADIIRPAGYFNIKAKRLKSFISVIFEDFESNLDKLFSLGLDDARRKLLDIKGIGPETADSILLYAGGLPTFVVDAYTKRILIRHNIIDEDSSYEDIRYLFMDYLPPDIELFNEYHALLVSLGKYFCKKKRPLCTSCPLKGI